MKQNIEEVATGRIPLDLLDDPNVTLDVVKVFALMDYLGPAGRRNMDAEELAMIVGFSEERVLKAVEFISGYDWIKLVPQRQPMKRGDKKTRQD